MFRHPTFFLYAERKVPLSAFCRWLHVKSYLFGNALVLAAITVYCGLPPSTLRPGEQLEAEAIGWLQKLRVDHLELRNVEARHADWPTRIYFTFRKEILPDEEANMLAIPAQAAGHGS